MTLHSEFDDKFKKETVARIDNRWAQLNQLTQDFADRCIRYLFITNAGGVVTIITYIGSAGIDAANAHHKSALILFVAGLVYAGVLNVLLLRFSDSLTLDWKRESRDYYDDKIHYSDLFDRDDDRAEKGEQYYYVGYCAFAFFIFGACIGLWAFFA